MAIGQSNWLLNSVFFSVAPCGVIKTLIIMLPLNMVLVLGLVFWGSFKARFWLDAHTQVKSDYWDIFVLGEGGSMCVCVCVCVCVCFRALPSCKL